MQAIRVYGFPEAGTTLESVESSELMPNYVRIQTQYSALNYKDMLAITGQGKIMRNFPLIAGIDVAGTVLDSQAEDFKQGDKVLFVGAGLGEDFNGGLASEVMLPKEAVIPMPKGWDAKTAMLIGTAGFSAAMAITQLQRHGIEPQDGEIIVTGTSGGVGLWTVRMLSFLGYDVVAVSRNIARDEAILYRAGAHRIISLEELTDKSRALQRAEFIGGIDQLGGDALSAILSKTEFHGAVCAIGMAQGTALNTTVMPFILRGVTLYGITSTNCPPARREQVWTWLGRQFDDDFIAQILYQEVYLDEVIDVCQKWSEQPIGRIIVNTQEKL